LETKKGGKIKKKIKNGISVPQGTSKGSVNVQLKRSKVKVTGCQNYETAVTFT